MSTPHHITGLNSQQVQQSRKQHGPNVLTPPPRKSLLVQFIATFNDPLIKILLVALLLSIGISVYELLCLHQSADVLLEPLGIFLAIMLATVVGFLVEVNANKKFDILNKMHDDTPVKVMREGKITQVPRRDIVVGDVVLLDAGEKIPADGELLDSVQMTVDESSFTGEPAARKSHREQDRDPEATYPTHVLLRGSSVSEGHGMMQVTHVGDATEYGKIYTDAQIENDLETPLMRQFDQLGRWIARGSYIVGAAIVLGRLAIHYIDGGFAGESLVNTLQYLIETVMLAVTLIVVSVPEGLPMSVTLSLALSMRRMLASHNLVRKMHACETMGATTIICTDKTGTLTQNQMQVYKAHFFGLEHGDKLKSGDEASIVVEHNLACNSTAYLDTSDPHATKAIGNPTEGALLLWLDSQGIDYLQLRDNNQVECQLPFSTENKYMATVISCQALGGKRLLLVKGASEILHGYCSQVVGGLDFDDITSELHAYQNKAMRTLGFAYKILDNDAPCPIADGKLKVEGMTFMGIVAISDPVRSEVPEAIHECLDAGLQVKIVTGDTPGTACEIGRQVGLWNDDDSSEALISGEEFAALPDAQAAQRAEKIKIMSRARPADKARLVSLLQQQGEVVAVTGDGTNDAPALNAAQVGLSMGDGTSVAKEASDITIMDNSFASIGKAVMWGRSLYKNIQRFILFQLTVNVAASLLVGICSFFSEQPALTVTQMLWVNLIMDTFAALALASLPPSKEVMLEKPRRNGEPIITKVMARFIFGVGLLFTIVMLGVFGYLLYFRNDGSGTLLSTHISPTEMTMYFTTFVFLQFWNLFNAKSFDSGHSAFHNMRESKVFFGIIAVIFIGQVLIVQFGGKMFNVVPMNLEQWVKIIVITMPVMLVGELWHRLHRPSRTAHSLDSASSFHIF